MPEPRSHALFLRGINLGRRRVKMADLRTHLTALGLEGVATLLASGNAVFDHDGNDLEGLERRVESGLAEALGFHADAFVRAMGRLEALAALAAVADGRAEGFTPHAVFLGDAADDRVRDALRALEGPDDRFLVSEREVVWFRRGGLSDAPISTSDLAKALGGGTHTMRTMKTVDRIVKKHGGGTA